MENHLIPLIRKITILIAPHTSSTQLAVEVGQGGAAPTELTRTCLYHRPHNMKIDAIRRGIVGADKKDTVRIDVHFRIRHLIVFKNNFY